MPTCETFDGNTLAYEVDGEGPDVLMLHGIVVDSYINFIRPGVTDAIRRAGFRVIMLDQRGHGSSSKPHDVEAYGGDAMVRDAQVLLDRLGVQRCGVVGYSMGAMVGMALASRDQRVRAAVFGGVGAHTLLRREGARSNVIADAMLAEDKKSVTDPIGKSFRDFADLVGTDRQAAAAASQGLPAVFELDKITIPALVLCGDNDPLAGDPQGLADRIAGATTAVVGGTHLNVVNNPEFHTAVVGFLLANREALS